MRTLGGRLLLYRHDSLGLGHLRHCRAIANALAERFIGCAIRILSGSPAAQGVFLGDRVEVVALTRAQPNAELSRWHVHGAA